MLEYCIKRLILFIPTIFIVSCLTFYLSRLVPNDEVEQVLSLQGFDDSIENYSEVYTKEFNKRNLNLPIFYFSIYPSYAAQTNHYSDKYERNFYSEMTSKRYRKSFCEETISLTKDLKPALRKRILSSSNPSEIRSKFLALDSTETDKIDKSRLLLLLDSAEKQKVQWHFPKFQWNGFNNQYQLWIAKVIKGEFGNSLTDNRPVTDKLWDALRWTIFVVFLNLFFVLLISFPVGVYNGLNQGSSFDKWSNFILFGFFAVPKFWLATLMIIFFTTSEFGSWTNIFPSVGRWYSEGSQSFLTMIGNSWQKLILPIAILVIPDVAYMSRLIRSSVKEEKSKEYVKTAISKGLSHRAIATKHIIPNSLIPTITLLAGTLPGALASAVVIEVIFNIPGIGRLMLDSIQNADWMTVYPIVLMISILAITIFLLADILMAWLNPKINLG